MSLGWWFSIEILLFENPVSQLYGVSLTKIFNLGQRNPVTHAHLNRLRVRSAKNTFKIVEANRKSLVEPGELGGRFSE